jgi:1-phosphofructokinase
MRDVLTMPEQVRSILSICFNPSLDLAISIHGIKAGCTNRYEAFRTDAGGKGINVARLLGENRFDSSVLISVPERCHDLYSYLEYEEFAALTYEVPGELRINIKINEPLPGGGMLSTEVNGAGEDIGEQVADDLYQMALTAVSGYGVVVQSGSLLPGIPPNIYAKISEEIQRSNGISILDSSHEPMLQGVLGHVDIFKPNLEEFRQLTDCNPASREDLVRTAAACCRKYDMALLLLSLGENGAILTDGRFAYSANVPTPERVQGKPVAPILSLTGAGDTMTAMLAAVASATPKNQSFAEYLTGLDPVWLLRLVMGAAQAGIRTPGTEMPHLEDIAAWYEHIVAEDYTHCLSQNS